MLPAYDTVIMMVDMVFQKKAHDYGASWRILRPISIIDQVFIKARRIRNIIEIKEQRITGDGNDIKSEFIGIVNYSAMGCIQLQKKPVSVPDIKKEESIMLYEGVLKQAQSDMLNRTNGKEDVTSTIGIETLNDLILQTIVSMKSCFNTRGDILGGNLKQNLLDIINYAIFALMIIDKESK